jgi:predicted ATPase
MLKSLTVCGFKSLKDVEVKFPRMAVLFGPNAAGKSNLLDAIQALSRIGTQRTLRDALREPIRGYPVEAFSFPSSGQGELLSSSAAKFSLEADLTQKKDAYRYRIAVEIAPASGVLSVADEYLTDLGRDGNPNGLAAIEQVEGNLRVRRKREAGKPRNEPLRQNHAILSDQRLGMPMYRSIEYTRLELSGWHTYYLDPHITMREARPPSGVDDIGVRGGDIAPFLYRLRAEYPKHFQAIVRTLQSLVPSVEDLTVDLDERRGTLDILVRQSGVEYSSRIVSDGTLRVLALCAIVVNPWGGSLLAFEEPENGIHPRRIELIAQLLLSLALEQGRQVIVTTHSPLFCDAVLKGACSRPDGVGLFNVRRDGQATVVEPFPITGHLFKDHEIAAALTTATEDSLFESLLLRGMLDE